MNSEASGRTWRAGGGDTSHPNNFVGAACLPPNNFDGGLDLQVVLRLLQVFLGFKQNLPALPSPH